jgi:hypothetical protein
MKIRYTFLGGLLLSCLIPALPAQAAPVQVDMRDVFNADVIVNGTSGNIDSTQSPVDNVSYSLATQGALVDCDPPVVQPTWQGLPNNGQFAGNGDHPFVQLAYRNSKFGKNAVRLEADQKVSFPVPRDKYRRIHLFAMSGDGDSSVKVTFRYMDNSTTVKNFTIGDWFEDPATGTYSLKEGMDRMTPDGTTCDESGHESVDADVFGKALRPNDNKVLRRMTVKRVLSAESSILNTFGVTGLKA